MIYFEKQGEIRLEKNAKRRVIAYLHTHWDREWYRTFEEFNLRLLEITDEILDELKNGSMSGFYFDGQTSAIEDYLKFRPEKLAEIKHYIKENRLWTGPFFVSADNFLVNGISLIRNLALGIEYSKNLGVKEFLGYLPDTFGHSKAIFEILKACKISHAFVWRGVPRLESNDFIINGQNATKLAMGYFMDTLHLEIEDIKKAESLEKILDRIAEKSHGDILLPIGADHLAALKNSKKEIEKINKFLKKYEIFLSSPFEYAKNADCSKLSISGELLSPEETYILPGVYSSRTPQKAENARLQWQLFRIAEVFNHITNGKYQSSLDYAAKKLIKNHAHDSIYGCSIDEVHRDVKSRYSRVSDVVNGVNKRLIRDFKRQNLDKSCTTSDRGKISKEKNVKKDEKYGVFNFSNYKYSGVVKVIGRKVPRNSQIIRRFKCFDDEILYDTRQIPVTEQYFSHYEYLIELKDLQPFSFSPINCVKPTSNLEISENKLANPLLELRINKHAGKLKIDFIDKLKKNEFKDALEIICTKDFGDSYNSAPDKKSLSYKLLETKVIEKGPIRAGLRLVFEHNFKLDVFLSNFSKSFEFEAKFNNKKKNQKIQVVLKLKKPVTQTFAEDAVGFIERKHDPDWILSRQLPATPKIEVKTNSYPMQRWVMAQDLGVITEGLNDYEICKNTLKFTLLRGTGRISEPKNPARYIPAGPPIETPELQCLGKRFFKFAITLNPDIASMYEEADTFYQSCIAIEGDFEKFGSKNFLKLPENLIFYGLKPNNGKTSAVLYNIGKAAVKFKGKEIKSQTLEFVDL